MHARKLCAPTGQGAAEGVTGDQNLLWLERGEVHSEPAAPRATNVADPPQVSQDPSARARTNAQPHTHAPATFRGNPGKPAAGRRKPKKKAAVLTLGRNGSGRAGRRLALCTCTWLLFILSILIAAIHIITIIINSCYSYHQYYH
jgi:hypothetical protein